VNRFYSEFIIIYILKSSVNTAFLNFIRYKERQVKKTRKTYVEGKSLEKGALYFERDTRTSVS
jgi:hypothetical protein